MPSLLFNSLPFILWILLAAANLVIQLAYFFNDRSLRLFAAKKITTPLLLFFGLLIVIVRAGGFPLIPGLILAVMGLGELGIEGSRVVESGDDRQPGQLESTLVTLAGVLFLLVNLAIGTVLLIQTADVTGAVVRLSVSGLFFTLLVLLLFRLFQPAGETRFQISVYSVSLVILSAGAMSDLSGGLSSLGLAAAVLTLSDFLVLLRMGAGLDKGTRAGFIALLILLTLILVLYYFYMAVLIGMAGQL